MLTLSFPHLELDSIVSPWMVATCETCGWAYQIRMADIFNSYAGVGDQLWRLCNHWTECKE